MWGKKKTNKSLKFLLNNVSTVICENQLNSNDKYVSYKVQKRKVMEQSFCLCLTEVFNLQHLSQQFQKNNTRK